MIGTRAMLFATFVSIGGALFGYDIGVISSCFTMKPFIATFGVQGADGAYVLSTGRQSMLTSLLALGTFLGSIFQAFLADLDFFGRKGSIFGWAMLFNIGCAVQVSAKAYGQLLAGRLIAGLGVGALSALVPLYNAETAPKALRGTSVVLYQVMITVGIFLAYGIDYGTESYPDNRSWQIPIGFQLVFGGIICLGMLFLPDSPRHYLGHGKVDKARRAIAQLNGCHESDPVVSETLLELEEMLALENEGGKARWIDLFGRGHQLWKRTLNACMLQFVQQLNGQNFYYYYGPTFFAQSNTGLNSYQIQLILGAVTFGATIPALYLIERLGRRKMLLIGCVGEIICAVIAGLAGHFMLAPDGTPQDQITKRNIQGGQLLVAFAILQIMFFACFWGPVPWVTAAESFPLRVRPKGIAAATATNWLWNFLLGFFSAKIAAKIGPLILLIFAGVLLYGFVYIYFLIPETAGKSLEEVDEMWASHVPAWKSASWTPPRNRKYLEGDDKEGAMHEENVQKRKKSAMVFAH